MLNEKVWLGHGMILGHLAIIIAYIFIPPVGALNPNCGGVTGQGFCFEYQNVSEGFEEAQERCRKLNASLPMLYTPKLWELFQGYANDIANRGDFPITVLSGQYQTVFLASDKIDYQYAQPIRMKWTRSRGPTPAFDIYELYVPDYMKIFGFNGNTAPPNADRHCLTLRRRILNTGLDNRLFKFLWRTGCGRYGVSGTFGSTFCMWPVVASPNIWNTDEYHMGFPGDIRFKILPNIEYTPTNPSFINNHDHSPIPSYNDCEFLCKQMPYCFSLNYYSTTQTCRLFGKMMSTDHHFGFGAHYTNESVYAERILEIF